MSSFATSATTTEAAPLPADKHPVAAAVGDHIQVPKVLKFSGANKCYVCEKTVYKMEEIIAVGNVWHDKCFTCGGKNSDGCKKTLKRDNYVDHGGQPYCSNCYGKLFKPKGFGVGTGMNTDYGVKPEENIVQQATKPIPVASPEQPAAPIGHGALPHVIHPLATAVEQHHIAYTGPKTVAFNGANKCTICTKTVYKMEEIIAVGRVWHNSCFTCGGARTDGCKRTLKRDNYVDHEGEPFCQACYKKLYTPKGFGTGGELGFNEAAASATK